MKKYTLLYILILSLTLFNCSDEAKTLSPDDLVTGTATPTAPGYNYPFIVSTAPGIPAVDLPTNVQLFVFFNKPMDTTTFTAANISVTVNGTPLTITTEYTITTASTYFIINFVSALPAGATVILDTTAGLRDSEGNAINYSTGEAPPFTFTIGAVADITAPTVNTGSNSPTGGTEPLTGLTISITLDEDIDPTTLNANTFYLEAPGPITIPVTYGFNTVTDQAVMTPQVNLEPGTIYTVTIFSDATTPIKDLSGNIVSVNHFWQFTTTATPLDPSPGAPGFVDTPALTLIDTTSASISWSTNESTHYSLTYGRNTDATLGPVTDSVASTYHSLIFGTDTAALTPGKRYWVDVAFTDIAANAGITATVEFNTATNESPNPIHVATNNQRTFNFIENKWGVTNSGFFGFWTNVNGTDNELYGELFNNTLTAQWSNPTPLFTGASYTFVSASEDHFGGVIVLAANGSDLSAKRITSAGTIYDWGSGTTDAGPGLPITSAAISGTGYAVPVYSNIIDSIISGTSDPGTSGTSLIFTNITFLTAPGDYVYNLADDTYTTITAEIPTDELTLNADIGLTAGEQFNVFNFNTENTNDTNIISNGSASVASTSTTLVDTFADFVTDGVKIGDVVYNFPNAVYAVVTNVTATTLTLDRDASFTGGGDNYCVINRQGVLYAWQEAGPTVRAKILTMNENPPVVLASEFTIGTNGQNPVVLSNNAGSALVIYEELSGTDKIRAALIDAAGNEITNISLRQTIDVNEQIIKVSSDGNGGVVILFKTITNNIYAQRVDSSCSKQWGIDGRTVSVATITSQQDFIYTGDDIIVVANVSNDIWAWRVGTTSWGPAFISQDTAVQQNPKAYLDGANVRIAWEDARYSSSLGYGIFGMSIVANTGALNWTANSPTGTGTDDYDGIALILNNYDDLYPTMDIVSYNNGSNAILVWEDHRTSGNGSDIVYYDFTSFAPYGSIINLAKKKRTSLTKRALRLRSGCVMLFTSSKASLKYYSLVSRQAHYKLYQGSVP